MNLRQYTFCKLRCLHRQALHVFLTNKASRLSWDLCWFYWIIPRYLSTAFKKLAGKQAPPYATDQFSVSIWTKLIILLLFSACLYSLIVVSSLNKTYSSVDAFMRNKCPFFIPKFNVSPRMQCWCGKHVLNYVGRLFCGWQTLRKISFDFTFSRCWTIVFPNTVICHSLKI